MHIVSFNVFRTLGFPNTTNLNRYLSEDGLNASLRYGTVRGYTSTEFSHSSSAVARGAQIKPEWGQPAYGVAIPSDKVSGFSVARPFGNTGNKGWEVNTNSIACRQKSCWGALLDRAHPLFSKFSSSEIRSSSSTCFPMVSSAATSTGSYDAEDLPAPGACAGAEGCSRIWMR